MTWEELVKKAKKLKYRLEGIGCCNESLREPIGEEIPKTFYKDGDIFMDRTLVSRGRTYEQMYQIMLALRD